MTFEEFCTLNGVDSSEKIHILGNAVFPEGEFTPRFTLMLYTSFGTSEIRINGKQSTVRRKSISLWQSGCSICFKPEESLRYLLLVIGEELLQYLDASSIFFTIFSNEGYPVFRITSAYNDALVHFFDSLRIVNGFQDNPYKDSCQLSIVRALFYSTGYYVFRSLRLKEGGLAKFATGYPSYGNGLTSKFIRLVEKMSTRERHLSYYAKELGYHPNYLSSLIKRETAYSGQAVIDQYAVLTAMSKLSFGRKSIKEISDEMSFQSQSDFGKFFKRMSGYSPREYRKNRLKRH